MIKTNKIEPNTVIKTKGFNISIGKRIDQIAIISQSNGEFIPFVSIKKSKRLSKIKQKFKIKLCSSTHFFFEHFSQDDILEIIKILK